MRACVRSSSKDEQTKQGRRTKQYRRQESRQERGWRLTLALQIHLEVDGIKVGDGRVGVGHEGLVGRGQQLGRRGGLGAQRRGARGGGSEGKRQGEEMGVQGGGSGRAACERSAGRARCLALLMPGG